ncbi:hypothetical protein N7499_006490 [Penicillium canescens]|uniref:Uncharacterized protein n=1 Tax=Penicillium canescens TaxID=5083 RepID=A0AAD6IDL7_PENCN|nr:uncharacterized protein N7446_002181 [Penicillium canescens]KAJ6043984.1 hypothetical protein N7460_005339 [Penicillium canescens]KAJ6055457.1 hypothetical protein N7444_004555 [Penicillium canescens]KAJ6074404.1 hypothetical protein N7446_002181 [Penicillium canescens]KAJ6081616.1 hypothetical protein N7499_006490 [Penicillium canescens]KAJ6176584.1 hypothetical protein N7485_003498 [Penicillium canescens]
MSAGRSRSVTQDNSVEVLEDKSSRYSKRRANLYDAVAGRVNPRGIQASQPVVSYHRDTASSGARPLRPEELLLRKQNTSAGPVSEQVEKTYFAHENLPADQSLPSSELLETIHAYAADFYEYATADNGQDDHKTMDETALLAMGILIEEMSKDALGETGDLVLVEGQELLEEQEEQTGAESDTTNQSAARIVRRKRASSNTKNRPKRRKLTRSASATTDVDTEVDDRR